MSYDPYGMVSYGHRTAHGHWDFVTSYTPSPMGKKSLKGLSASYSVLNTLLSTQCLFVTTSQPPHPCPLPNQPPFHYYTTEGPNHSLSLLSPHSELSLRVGWPMMTPWCSQGSQVVSNDLLSTNILSVPFYWLSCICHSCLSLGVST